MSNAARQLVDQLKVWSATVDMGSRDGRVNYDRLANAGMPGRIVLHNMLGRMHNDAVAHKEAALPAGMEDQEGVSLRLGGAISYAADHLMVAESVVLVVNAPKEELLASASVGYSLANEAGESWKFSTVSENYGPNHTYIYGNVSGPISGVRRRVIDDYRQALNDPTNFIGTCAERLIKAGGLDRLERGTPGVISSLVARPE